MAERIRRSRHERKVIVCYYAVREGKKGSFWPCPSLSEVWLLMDRLCSFCKEVCNVAKEVVFAIAVNQRVIFYVENLLKKTLENVWWFRQKSLPLHSLSGTNDNKFNTNQARMCFPRITL